MTIGGYVAFMNNIKATNALVYISMKPLGLFSTLSLFGGYYSYSYWTITFYYYSFSCRIRIVACGFGLSCLISLGVSQLTALSVIAAATLFDQGPGSANTAMAAELIGQSSVEYFITHQLPLVIPTSLVVWYSSISITVI